jgi:hypothetical protein
LASCASACVLMRAFPRQQAPAAPAPAPAMAAAAAQVSSHPPTRATGGCSAAAAARRPSCPGRRLPLCCGCWRVRQR